jgi:two-component system cell cycle sensor histidine kinase/response regulator CckA
MADVPRTNAPDEAYSHLIDRILSEDSVEVALAHGARALAQIGAADVVALFIIEGSECVLQAWHPPDPEIRERHEVRFRAAVDVLCGRGPGPGADAASAGEAPQTLPLVAAGRTIGAICLSGGAGAPGRVADLPLARRLAGALACVAAAHRERCRSSAMQREYERWFKKLDEQVRVLERERQKFSAIVHQSDSEVFVTDPAQLIRWTNNVLASNPPSGHEGASWIGLGCRAVCSRLDDPEAPPECGTCPVAQSLKKNAVVHHEFMRSNHDEPRMLYLSALPIKGPDGLPHEVLVMIQDLSDLKVLRRSESRYRLLFERSAKAIVMVEPASRRVVLANPMARRMTGHPADTLVGLILDDLHSPAEWARLAERYGRGFAEGNLAPFECRVRARDGEELLATVSGTRYDLDGQEVAMLEFQDVTETRRVEQALRDAEERLRSVVANAPVILFAVDETGIFTLSEGQGLATLGLAPGEVVGRSVFEMYADHPGILENIRGALAGEERIDTVDLGLISFETWLSPLRGPDGVPRGLIGVSTDITQRRRLEDQLRQAQKMEAIGCLAGGVAHDFNNLLAAIMGHGELMMRRLDASHPLHRHAEAIQKAATRGAMLTRQLLAFSRKEVLAPRVLDVHLAVAELEEMLRRLIGEHIELVIVLGDRPLHVRADRGQIEQVIMNLAVNARDAMGGGGVLTIEVAHVDLAGTPGDKARPAGPYVVVSVTDTGCGMEAVTVSRIFEPFFTTKDQGKGTGLGLSTVYGIVEQSHGYVEVESAPGAGTSFKVFLPRVDEAVGVSGTEGTGPIATRGSETMLLAEDEPALRAMAREALQNEGYTVLEASNGVEALAAAAAHRGPLHLLITDVVMPQMGGGELAQRLQAERPGIKVLFMSGYTDDAVIRQGVSEATSTFLQKPFTIAAFARKVRETLDGSATPAAREDSPPARAA